MEAQQPWAADAQVVSGAVDGRVRVWDLRRPQAPMLALQASAAGLVALAPHRGGLLLAASDEDCRIHTWDLRQVGGSGWAQREQGSSRDPPACCVLSS